MKNRTGRRYRLRLELVRQIGSNAGDPQTGYQLVVPLDPDGHIDATSWSDDPAACSVRHFHGGYPESYGRLARSPRGRWYFDYSTGHDAEDHKGIRRGDERFRVGAFVAVNEDDGRMRTFRVTSMEGVGE